MSTYVFAIGGTGVRVLRSLTMLLAAGCKGCSSTHDIVPIVIDYDKTNGDTKRTTDLLKNYQKIHQAAYDNQHSCAEHFFCTPLPRIADKIENRPVGPILVGALNEMDKRYTLDITDVPANTSYADYIGFNHLSEEKGTQQTRDLLTSLYDASDSNDPCTELNLNLEKGFKGCPNIGCVVTEGLKNNQQILNLLGLLNPVSNDRVIVIGSLFGGTGAAGIPLVIDLIRNHPNGKNIPLGVLAVMPYFKIESIQGSAINSATFKAKTKAALHAYQSSLNKKINVIYYIGDEAVNQGLKYNEGGPGQKNRAHVIEFISAMGIMHFTGVSMNQAANEPLAYEYGLEDDPADGSALRYASFYKEETRDLYFDSLTKLVVFNTFCKKYFLANKEDANDTWLINTTLKTKNDFKNELSTFIDAFNEWLGELESGDRQLKLYNVEKGYVEVLAWKKLVIERKFWRDKYAYSEEDIRTLLAQSYDTHKGEQDLAAHPERMFFVNMQEAMKGISQKIEQFNN